MSTPGPVVRRIACLLLSVTLLFGAAGCSSEDTLNPVSGKVLAGGKPAAGALVIFHPDGPTDLKTMIPSARVEADGSFTLTTGDKPGAKAGKYVVTIRWPDPNKKFTEMERMKGGASPDDAPDLLKGKYEARDGSTLRAEIKPGENKLEPFDLK